MRKELDLTQQAFADKLGVSRNSVATYETGKSNPSDAAIALICSTYNVNRDWLENGNGEMFLQIDEDEELMRWAGTVLSESDESFRKRFVNMLRRLDEKDWETLEKIAIMLYDGEKK